MTVFENLSDEIIISIIEYLSLEDFTSIFGPLNERFSCLIYDHPWTQHQLNIKSIDKETLKTKLHLIDDMRLIGRISSIDIHPFSIFRSIEDFHELQPIQNFENLRALSLNHITLDEAEAIFTSECFDKLCQLARLRLIFSFGLEQNSYSDRIEELIKKLFTHPPLRICTLQMARRPEFSQIESTSNLEYLDIDYCNFQSLYTLLKHTPNLRHLSVRIGIHNEIETEQTDTFPFLTSLKLTLSIPAYEQLTNFLEKCPKLQKLHVLTYSLIEPLNVTSDWHKFITEYLPVLTKFKRECKVTLENIAQYIDLFHWPNGWKSKDKSVPDGPNYSKITIVNVRY